MAKIVIAGVKRGEDNHSVHVILTEPQMIDGEEQQVALGEAFIPVPDGTKPAKVTAGIIKAARGIMAKHKQAVNYRQKLEQVEFPEITE